jgi:hypothetical protein
MRDIAKEKTTRSMLYQSNMRIGWALMVVYWFVGYVFSTRHGYVEKLIAVQDITIWHGGAFAATLFTRQRLNPRYDRYGRHPDFLAITIYSLFNGVFETFMFFAVYDCGRKDLAKMFGLTDRVAIGLGFSIYFVYAALIHSLFWLPLVFPRHIVDTAPPFLTHGLPNLTLVSVCWLGLYEIFEDVLFVCFLHCIQDFGHGLHSSIPYLKWDEHGNYLSRKTAD